MTLNVNSTTWMTRIVLPGMIITQALLSDDDDDVRDDDDDETNNSEQLIHYILSGMLSRNKGAIVNIGSGNYKDTNTSTTTTISNCHYYNFYYNYFFYYNYYYNYFFYYNYYYLLFYSLIYIFFFSCWCIRFTFIKSIWCCKKLYYNVF